MCRLLVSVCLVVLVGLATAHAQDDKGVTLTDKDSGKKVELKKGEVLAVKLEFTAGTGFTWVIAKNDVKHLAPQGKPKVIPGKKGVVGGGDAALRVQGRSPRHQRPGAALQTPVRERQGAGADVQGDGRNQVAAYKKGACDRAAGGSG